MAAVTAKTLSKSGTYGKEIDSIVREYTQIIDDKLLRHDRTWGRNVVFHDLPTNLTLPGLKKADAQRMMYSAIIRAYEKRGFEVAIVLKDEMSRIYIAWATELSGEEVAAMSALIMARRIEESEIEQFRREGRISAPEIRRPGEPEPTAKMREKREREMRARGGVVNNEPPRPASPEPSKHAISAAEAALLEAK